MSWPCGSVLEVTIIAVLVEMMMVALIAMTAVVVVGVVLMISIMKHAPSLACNIFNPHITCSTNAIAEELGQQPQRAIINQNVIQRTPDNM
jgi:hypothetical protein